MLSLFIYKMYIKQTEIYITTGTITNTLLFEGEGDPDYYKFIRNYTKDEHWSILKILFIKAVGKVKTYC